MNKLPRRDPLTSIRKAELQVQLSSNWLYNWSQVDIQFELAPKPIVEPWDQ